MPNSKNRLDLPIPSDLRRTVLGWFGTEGQGWIDTLPETVGRLAEQWGLELGAPLAGGSASLVLAGSKSDGTPAVLKVPFLDDENRTEADALKHYAGAGAVWLYESDLETGAMLLERVTPGTPLAEHPDRDQAIDIACGVLRRLWHPPKPGHRFPLVHDVALHWADRLPAAHFEHGSPFPISLVDEAARQACVLAQAAGAEVVVNRDAHLGNILAAQREPWLLIDPKPLVGNPAFDAGYLLLDMLDDSPTPIRTNELVQRLAVGLGVDREQIRGWALVRAVENTLWALDLRTSPEADLARARALLDGR